MAAENESLHQGIERETRRLVVDALYSGRGHQQAANRWATLNTWLGIPSTIASALLASGAAVSALASDRKTVTAGLALLAAGLTALQGYLRPGEREDEYAAKGNRYITLRNDARLLLELELRAGTDLEQVEERLRELRNRYNALTEEAPRRIPRWAYQQAKQSIEAGESRYEDDPAWRELEE